MTQQDIDASEAPLIEHLIELRTRLIWCVVGFIAAFIVSFFFSSDILHFLVLPFKWGTGQDVSLISIKLLGVFLVKLKIAFFGGLFIGFPLIATQIYRFMAPGLYKHEKQAFLPYLFATPDVPASAVKKWIATGKRKKYTSDAPRMKKMGVATR